MKKLSKKMIEKFLQNFMEKRQVILDAQVRLHSADIDAGGDEVDLIQGTLLKNMMEKLSSRDRQALNRIDEAIGRIHAGTFGKCEECEDYIPEKRLMVLPESKFCVDCAEQQEKFEKQFGS